MAEQDITMKFEGTGDLLPFLRDIRTNVNGLREDSGKTQAAIQSDLKKSADSAKQFSTSLTSLGAATKSSREQAISDLVKLGVGYQDAAKSVDKLTIQTSLLSASERTAAADGEDVFKTLRSIIDAASQTPEGIAALSRDLSEAEQSAIDLLVATKGLTKEEAELVAQGAKLKNAFDDAEEPVESLRGKLQRAKDEAFAIGEKFGSGSAQFAAAASKAGKIADEVDRINKTVDAFNPGKKLAAVLQLGEGAVGAFTAINSVVSAIGGDSEETEKALKRVEQGVGFLIGAQSAIRGFTEGWASLKAILGGLNDVEKETEAVTNLVAIAQERAALAASTKAAASEAATVAARAQAIADEQSVVAQEALLAAQAAGLPINEALTVTKVEQAAATEAAAVAQVAQAEAQAAAVVATEASVVATEADVVAKSAQTVATTATATATGGLSGALRALWVVMAANPIGVIIAALAAAVGLFLLFSESAKDATADVDNLLRRMKFFDDEVKRGRGFRKELADIQQEIDNLSSDDTPARQREQAIKSQNAQLEVLQADLDRAIESQAALLIELGKLDPNADNVEENRKKIFAKIDEQVKIIADAGAERVLIEERTGLKVAQINNKEKEDAIALAKKRAQDIKQIREQLADQLAAIEKQLADKVRELQLNDADPRKRLELEKQAADEELALLERNLQREVALQSVKVEKLIELSQKEKDALADKIIDQGGGKLSTAQEEALATARLLILKDYFTRAAQLQAEFDLALADASGDAQVREMAALDALLLEREAKLKAAGATPAEIEADAQRQTLLVQNKFAKDRIDRETQTQVDILEAQLNGGDLSVEQEKALQIALLEVKIKGAKDSLAIIVDDGTARADAEIAAAKNVVSKLEKELIGLKENIKPFRLSDLFNLEGDDADRFNEVASQLSQSILDIVSTNNAARQAELDAQIENTDAIIDDLRRRGDELQAQLQRDEELNKQGLANNLNATLSAIEENKKAEAAALAEKKRIQAEKQKLAKQQVITDSITQASSLAVSAANTIAGLSTLPLGLGILTAFGLIAQMYSFFTGFKAKLAAAAAPQGLWKGTKSVQLNGAPKGRDTIPVMLDEDEAVISARNNAKYRPIVGALVDDDFSGLTPKQLEPILAQINIAPYLAEHGITVNERSVTKVVTMNNTHRDTVEKSQAVNMAGMERRMDELTKVVRGFQKQEKDREVVEVVPPNSTVTRKRRGKTEITRP